MFCIMRTEKRKRTDITGIQKENNRTATGYNNSVNRERSELNVPLIQRCVSALFVYCIYKKEM